MLKFFNREHELAALDEDYSRRGFSFTVIYGRRRVGKTELVRQFLKRKSGIYYQCDRRGTTENMKLLRRIAARYFGDMEPAADSILDVLRYVKKKSTGSKKLVLVIDEIPYLIEQDRAVTSEIQKAIDTELTQSNIHLIILGSSIGMMKRDTLSEQSPLYGRRSSQIKVRPFGLRQLLELFPSMNPITLVKVYGAFGGMPFYLQFVDLRKSFYDNLKDTMFNKAHVLYSEGEFLIKEELPRSSTYMRILDAIASGATKNSEIATKTGVRAMDLPHYLKRLQTLELVQRTEPAIQKRTKGRKSIYRIADPFMRFWFRYVLHHLPMIEYGDFRPVFDDLDETYNTFLGHTFEEITREYLIFANLRNTLPFRFNKIGSQWGKIPRRPKGLNQYEIDHVAYDKLGESLILAETKWQNDVDPRMIEQRLRMLMDEVPELTQWKQTSLIGFARSFKPQKKDTELIMIDLQKIISDFKTSIKK